MIKVEFLAGCFSLHYSQFCLRMIGVHFHIYFMFYSSFILRNTVRWLENNHTIIGDYHQVKVIEKSLISLKSGRKFSFHMYLSFCLLLNKKISLKYIYMSNSYSLLYVRFQNVQQMLMVMPLILDTIMSRWIPKLYISKDAKFVHINIKVLRVQL